MISACSPVRLFVPTVDSVVEIRGEVRRPMAYELSGGETVADLIKWPVDSPRRRLVS